VANQRLLEGTITFKEGHPFSMAAGNSSYTSEKNQLSGEIEVTTKVGKQSVPLKLKVRPDTDVEAALRPLLDAIRTQEEAELQDE